MLALVAVIAVSAFPSAHAIEPCFTPIADADAFSGGSENTVRWFGDISGGFTVEVAEDPTFTTVLDAVTVSRFSTERTFDGLEEREYFYRVRAEARGTTCAQSEWSDPVSTIQDQTPSIASITTEPTPIEPTPITPPMPVYILEDEVRIDGTSEDPPGGDAPAGAGPAFVVISLVQTTPIIGSGEDGAVFELAQVDADGTWLVRFTGENKPSTGTYSVFATGIDKVGNEAEEPVELGFIVIL